MRFVPPKLLRNSEIRLDFLGCFDKEAVATIYTKEDEGRALSVFADSAGAEALGIRAGFREGFEAASVTPEEISKICARHGLALVALYGFSGRGILAPSRWRSSGRSSRRQSDARSLFRILRLIGDARAIARGRLPQRLARRSVHKRVNRWWR